MKRLIPRRALPLIASLALVAGLGVVQSVDSAQPAEAQESQQAVGLMCHAARPWPGYVIFAKQQSSTAIQCIEAVGTNHCIGYWLFWYGAWNGPYAVQDWAPCATYP